MIPVAIQNDLIRFQVPDDARENLSTRAAAPSVVYIPNKEWGTIMFEDLWPEYGDFDFNDIVFNYKIQLYLSSVNKVAAMLIGFRINAVGGNIPYNLYLQLDKITNSDVAVVEPYGSFTNGKDIKLKQLEGDANKPFIITFQNARENVNKKAGSPFLNTEKGFEIPGDKLVTFGCYIEFENSQSITGKLKVEDFNFFIGYDDKNQFKEIHIGGSKPSSWGENTYRTLKEKHNMKDFYYGKNNLIWGVNVPAAIPHSYERIDFTKSYPNFIKWAESGGKEHADWYTNASGNRVNENLCPIR